MELVELLEAQRDEVVEAATAALDRCRLPHYRKSGDTANRDRMARLHELTVECLHDRTLVPMVRHAESVARERHAAGFDLGQVHTAFNVFEEVVWSRITDTLEPDDYRDALGSVSTILGAGKEALALEYVALASSNRPASLDMSELFRGG